MVITAEALAMIQFNILGSAAFGGVFIEQVSSVGSRQSLTQSQIAWVIAVLFIGNLVGNVLSSLLNPRLGAVRVMQLCAPLVAGGWLALALGDTFWSLVCGRALNGLGIGLAFGPAIIHLGEIAAIEIRGLLSTLMLVNGCLGMLCMYLSGWLLGWRKACLVVGIVPMVLLFVVMSMMPRSAKWLISKGYPAQEAERSLRFYHGQSHDVTKELDEIRQSLGEKHKNDASLLEVLSLLKLRVYRVPILIVLGVYTFLSFSGGLVISSYAPVVFTEVGGFHSPYVGSILLSVVRLVFAVISSLIVERLQRGTLLMLNGAAGAGACLVAGAFFHYGAELAGLEWVSLVAVLCVVCSMSVGVAPMGIVLLSELVPNAVRAELGGLCLLYNGLTQFVVAYLFPLTASSLGMAGLFWFFSAVHVLMFCFAKLCVPESKGKSIEEIQRMFETGTGETDGAKTVEH
ncbi:facilitated trehalose transporter Tret1-like isoform X2 [Amphibalanus amphitrite]|uniref:facilitated trehalose transporter Tret1-like isoform X2 n=1 Tax=Amphibalanus amphitrite TaxID=1232801 RepID=UPI001C9278D2|nr:facilitated trehalose transporter Tret1-like isoform X2 [Amphibalanus amphitrite]